MIIDQVILDIISIVFGGAGLYVVVTKYNVPETRINFYGKSNAFKEKANIIEDIMTTIFTTVTAISFFILIIKYIFGVMIPERLYTKIIYSFIFIVTAISAYFLVKILNWIGNRIARKKWFPIAKNSYTPIYELIKNDWIKSNPEKAEEATELIEKILDIKVREKDLKARLIKIGIIFEK